MPEEIEKSEQPSSEEIATAILSFNDPAIITNLFKQLGWSYSLEIQETVTLAKQNANLSIKFKAIKHLRELLREAAETAGYIANVSSTSPNAHGGHTTFSAKRIAGILNPVKQIKSTEIEGTQNEQRKTNKPQTEHLPIREKSDRGCDRRESQETRTSDHTKNVGGNKSIKGAGGTSTDTREVFPVEDVGAEQRGTSEPADSTGLGSPKSRDRGTPPELRPGPGNDDCLNKDNDGENSGGSTGSNIITENPHIDSKYTGKNQQGNNNDVGNPCVKTRPPTCDRDLYPGISSAGD